MLSGDRSGAAVLWDLAAGAKVRPLSGHGGHVTAVMFFGALCLTGAQDGKVRVWDARAREAVAVVAAHTTDDGGAGAVSDICATGCGKGGEMEHLGGNVVVTAGADKTLRVLDPRASFVPRARFAHHKDFIYSLTVAGSLAISGGGGGLVLVHDLTNGKLLYGRGANRAAVRCLAATTNQLVTAGDDGTALIFDYE